jgi:hypothetical protein
MSKTEFTLYDHQLDRIGFGEIERAEHKVTETTEPKVGDYLYVSRALSGPEDMTTFHRVLRVTPKQVVVQEQLYDLNHTIKEVRLKKHKYQSSTTDRAFYSYLSGRHHFSYILSAKEHSELLAKVAGE